MAPGPVVAARVDGGGHVCGVSDRRADALPHRLRRIELPPPQRGPVDAAALHEPDHRTVPRVAARERDDRAVPARLRQAGVPVLSRSSPPWHPGGGGDLRPRPGRGRESQSRRRLRLHHDEHSHRGVPEFLELHRSPCRRVMADVTVGPHLGGARRAPRAAKGLADPRRAVRRRRVGQQEHLPAARPPAGYDRTGGGVDSTARRPRRSTHAVSQRGDLRCGRLGLLGVLVHPRHRAGGQSGLSSEFPDQRPEGSAGLLARWRQRTTGVFRSQRWREAPPLVGLSLAGAQIRYGLSVWRRQRGGGGLRCICSTGVIGGHSLQRCSTFSRPSGKMASSSC